MLTLLEASNKSLARFARDVVKGTEPEPWPRRDSVAAWIRLKYCCLEAILAYAPRVYKGQRKV
jgi:hypothetical protein